MKSDKGFEHRRERIIRKIDSQENKENNRTRSLQKEFKKMYGNDYPLYEHYLSPRKRLVRSKSPEKAFYSNSPYSQLLRAMVGHRREPLPGQMEEISPFESITGKPLNQLVKSKSSIQTTTYEGNNIPYNLSNYQSEYYQPQHQQRNSPSYESSQQSRDEENENSEYSSSAKKSRRTREDRKKDKKASRDSPLNRLLNQVSQYSSNNQQNQLKMKSEPTRNVISSWTNYPTESKNFESCPYNSPSLSITDKRLSYQQIDQQNYEKGIINPSSFSSNTEKQSSPPHEKKHYNSSPQRDKRDSHQNPNNNYYSADVQHYPSLGSAGKADFPDRSRTPSQVTVTESLEKGDQEWTLRSKEYDEPKKSSSSSQKKRSQERDESVHNQRRSSKNSEPKSAKKLIDVETQYSDKDGPYLNKDKNSEKSVSRKSHSRKHSETNPLEKSLRRDSSQSQNRSKRESSKREKSEEPNNDGSRSSFKKASDREKSSSSKSQHSLSKKQRTPSAANTSEEYVSDNNRSMRGKEVEYQWEEQSDDQSAKKSRNSKSRSKREKSEEQPNRDRSRSSNSKSQQSLSKNARTPSITSNTESDNNRSMRGKDAKYQLEEHSNDESVKKSRSSKSPSKSRTSKIHSPSQSREEFNASNERNSQSHKPKNRNSDQSENFIENQSKSAKNKSQSQNQNAVDYETDSKNGSLFFNESFGMPSEIEQTKRVPSKAKTTISDDRSDEDKLNKNRGYSSETPNYKKSSSSSKSEYSEGAHQTNTLIDQILKGNDKDDKISNRRSSQNHHNTSMSSQNKSLIEDKTPTFAQSEPEFNRKASNSNNQEPERDTRQAKSEVLDRNRESRNREKIQSVLAKGREKSKQRDSQETIQNSLHKSKRTESPNNNISSSEISASAQSDNINRTPERPKRNKNKMQEYLSSNSKATVEEDHRKYKENKPKPKYDFKSDGLFSSDSPKPAESDFDSPGGSNSIYSRNQQNSEKLYATAPKEEFVSSDSPNEKASYQSGSSQNKIIESDLDSRQKDVPESGKEIISSKNSMSPSRKKSKHKEEISSHSDRKSKKSGSSALKTDTISSCDSFVREEEAIKKASEEENLSQFSQQNNDKNKSSSRSKSKNKSQASEEAIMSQKELFEKKPKRVIETSEKEIQTQRTQEEPEEKKGVYGEKLQWNDLKTAYKIQEQAVIKIQRYYRKSIKGIRPAPEQLDESITQEDLMTFIQTLKKQETSLNDFKLTLKTEEQKDEVISLMLAFISSYCSLGKTEYPVRK